MKRFLVIGGGISGLAAAHRLCEISRASSEKFEITLLEASGRFGGVIETRRRDGFLLEGGPDAFITDKPWALDLCKRLGLGNEIIATNPACRRSFIVYKSKLVPVPEGFYLIAPTSLKALFANGTLSWPGKLRFLADIAIPPKKNGLDESVGSFIRRRFGKEALDRIGQPMIGGIYTADPGRLSLKATFPQFIEAESRFGSVIRGFLREESAARQASGPRYGLFASLKGGVGSLVEALAAKMPEVSLRLSSPVVRLQPGDRWTAVLSGGGVLEADAVCAALPARQAAGLLESFDPQTARRLKEASAESVATVNMAFRRKEIPHSLEGFGFVVPAVEKASLIGCTFSSVKFSQRAPEGMVLLRAFVGGPFQKEMMVKDDLSLERTVLEGLRRTLGIEAPPRFVSIQRYHEAMPVYTVGHLDWVEALEKELSKHPGLYVTGGSYRGVGIPDCIRQAEAAAERMAAQSADSPRARGMAHGV